MEVNKNVRIRINLSTREFEIDADSDFVIQKFGDKIFEYLDIVKSSNSKTAAKSANEYDSTPIANSDVPNSFGEYYNKFPKGLNNVDKLLISCYFIQSSTEAKAFTVKEASDLLIDQGVKLTNANAFNTSNFNTKRIFKLTGRSFKVSDIGKDYINNLLKSS
jgi:hypothetical protein